MDSALIFQAIEFAAAAHSGQYRKGSRIPYITHPLRVSQILLEEGCDDALAIAGVLHDTVEDCHISIKQIRSLFGEDVAFLVEGATEPHKWHSWEARKRHTIDFLQTATSSQLMLALADKLDNIRSIRADLERIGEQAWSRFHRGRDQQRWYYRSLAEVFTSRLQAEPGERLALVFAHEVAVVFPEN